MPTASSDNDTFVYGFGEVRLFFAGTGIVYDKPTGKRIPVGGTIDLIIVQKRGPLVDGTRTYIDQYKFDDFNLAIPSSGISLPTFAGFLFGNDEVLGSTGNDLLRGFGGNDILAGSRGADTLIGGPGRDTIDYSFENSTRGVKITLGPNAKIVDAFGSIDVPQEVEVFKGNKFADMMSGDTNANEFHGEGGRDNLAGNAGDDRLFGGADDDTLNDDDTLSGGDGNDYIDGGPGKDKISGGNDFDSILRWRRR